MGVFYWPSCSSILSHSSRMKCFMWRRLSVLLRVSARILPGVPTTMWGQSFFSTSSSFFIDSPPKNTATCSQTYTYIIVCCEAVKICAVGKNQVKVFYLNSGHVLWKSLILLADLKGQLSGMAQNQDRHLEKNSDSFNQDPLITFNSTWDTFMAYKIDGFYWKVLSSLWIQVRMYTNYMVWHKLLWSEWTRQPTHFVFSIIYSGRQQPVIHGFLILY